MLKLSLDIIQKVKPKNFCISIEDCMYTHNSKICPFCGKKCKVDRIGEDEELVNYRIVCINCRIKFSFLCRGVGERGGESNHFVTTEEMLER